MANNFNKDMNKVFGMVYEWFDLGETLISWLYNSKTEEYEFDEGSFFFLLHDIVNYDMICISEKKIDVDASNHPELAKVLKKYASKENINKVYNSIFN